MIPPRIGDSLSFLLQDLHKMTFHLVALGSRSQVVVQVWGRTY